MPDQEPLDTEAMAIPPMPVPTQFAVIPIVMPDTTPAIVVRIESSTGCNMFFISRETALELASLLKRGANTGPQLVTPASGLVVP